MSAQGWRADAQMLRFQLPEYQVEHLYIEYQMGSSAADRNRDWAVVKEAIPALLSSRITPALGVLELAGLDTVRAWWILSMLPQARTRALEIQLYNQEWSDAFLAELRRSIALGRVHRLDIGTCSLYWLTKALEPLPPGAGYYDSVRVALAIKEGVDASAVAEQIRHSVGVYAAAHPLRLCDCTVFVASPEGTAIPTGLEPSRGLWRMLELGNSLVHFGFGGDSIDLLTPAHLDVFEECLRERVRAGRELRGIILGSFFDEGVNEALVRSGLERVASVMREVTPQAVLELFLDNPQIAAHLVSEMVRIL